MKPEEFKKLGLKSGDRVEVLLKNNGGVSDGMYISTTRESLVWLREGEVLPFYSELKGVKKIKKLKVTKKKEQLVTQEQYNELAGIADRVFPKLDQTKSLSNLEVGDEVEQSQEQPLAFAKIENKQGMIFCDRHGNTPWFKMSQGYQPLTKRLCAKCYGEWIDINVQQHGQLSSTITHNSSIIDEMIEYFEFCKDHMLPELPKQLKMPEHEENYNKFITYLTKLKNKETVIFDADRDNNGKGVPIKEFKKALEDSLDES